MSRICQTSSWLRLVVSERTVWQHCRWCRALSTVGRPRNRAQRWQHTHSPSHETSRNREGPTWNRKISLISSGTTEGYRVPDYCHWGRKKIHEHWKQTKLALCWSDYTGGYRMSGCKSSEGLQKFLGNDNLTPKEMSAFSQRNCTISPSQDCKGASLWHLKGSLPQWFSHQWLLGKKEKLTQKVSLTTAHGYRQICWATIPEI